LQGLTTRYTQRLQKHANRTKLVLFKTAGGIMLSSNTSGGRSSATRAVESREPLQDAALEEALDEALMESFPASDPVAINFTFIPWPLAEARLRGQA
jgi:hypothetical protein